MEENKNKYNFRHYFVRSQRMCGWLLYEKGFILLGMEPDREYSRRNIFRFSNSEPLRQAIDEYKQLKNKI